MYNNINNNNERDSNMPQISANANNIPNDAVDCGIVRFNWCRGPACQKYATLRVFVAVLAFVSLLQGASETYFRISAKQAAAINGYNAIVVDWLVVSSGIFAAIFSLAFAYWAHRRHIITWLGGVFMLQAAIDVIAVIPSIVNFSGNPSSTYIPQPSSHMCTNTTSMSIFNGMQSTRNMTPESSTIASLVLMFILQMALGLGTLAFYTIAIVYIDDNSPSVDSPAVIACILTAKLFGLQVGSLLVMSIEDTTLGWWLGWLILAPLTFAGGFAISLFPRIMPKTVIHLAAQRIMEETDFFANQFSTILEDTAFMPSMKRLFNNKLLMFNIVSMMFIEAASINYLLQQESYLQSRFFLPYDEQDGLSQEWQAKLISYFLQPPVAGVAMLVCGLIISKIAPSARTIAGINVVQGLILMCVYISYTFLNCSLGPIAGISGGKITQPYCSHQCICNPNTFLPVCPENTTVTYFSPCYAGCTSKTKINNIEFYEGCTCDSNSGSSQWTNIRATLGPCSANECLSLLISFQVLSVFAAGVMGMITMSKLILLLRSVLPQDKALALALQIMFIGLFTYIPTHLAYQLVTRVTCLYWAPSYKRCLLRENPKHGNILDLLSAGLLFMGVVFDLLVFWYAKHLNVYNCKVIDENYTPSLYSVPSTRRSDDPSRSLSPGSMSLNTATTMTAVSSPKASLNTSIRPPRNEITVFRNPSSVASDTSTIVGGAGVGGGGGYGMRSDTSSPVPSTSTVGGSTGVNGSVSPNGVTYAEVVFPPDKHKPDDGTTSPKRMVVRADVPLHHLSAHDVRLQLSQLRSFNPEGRERTDTMSSVSTQPEAQQQQQKQQAHREREHQQEQEDDAADESVEMTPLMSSNKSAPTTPTTTTTPTAATTNTTLRQRTPQTPETDL